QEISGGAKAVLTDLIRRTVDRSSRRAPITSELRLTASLHHGLTSCSTADSQMTNSWLLEHSFMASTIAPTNVNTPLASGETLSATTPPRICIRPHSRLGDYCDAPGPATGLALAHPFGNRQRFERHILQCQEEFGNKKIAHYVPLKELRTLARRCIGEFEAVIYFNRIVVDEHRRFGEAR